MLSKMIKKTAAVLTASMMVLGTSGILPVAKQINLFTPIIARAESFVPRTTPPSTSDPNYTSGNVFHTSGYGMPNCTCYAYGRAKELLGYNPSLSLGNAQEWYGYNIRTNAYSYGSEPKLGAIACWDHSLGGHVAVVESIDGDTIGISESSWGGDYFKFRYVNKNNMASATGVSGAVFQGYIYIGDWESEPTPPNPYNPVSIPDGDYRFENVGTGMYMNYGWGWRSNPKGICASNPDGSAEQNFRIKNVGGNKYTISILHSDGGYVNSNCEGAPHSGTTITRWGEVVDDTQMFYFCKAGDSYLIASAANKDALICSPSENDKQLYYSNYSDSNTIRWRVLDMNDNPLEEKKVDAPTPVEIKEGVYRLKNCATGRYMNYGWGWKSDPKGICASDEDGSVEQKFLIKQYNDKKYTIATEHSDGGYVNSNCATGSSPTSGTTITRWGQVEDDTARFYFCKQGNNYVITSACNGNVAITDPGENDKQLYYSNYDPNDLKQQWQLVAVESAVTTTTTVSKTMATTTSTALTSPAAVQTNFIKGIDVSKFQSDIDWKMVASTGVKFAIIRSATTHIKDAEYMEDPYFESNYRDATDADIMVGTYIYTSANSKEEMKSNIDDLLKTIEGKKFDLPVYLDIEQATRQSDLGKKQLTEVISYGCSLIRAAGYEPGVYANKNWFNNYVDADLLRSEGVEIWMAAWPYSDKAADPADYDYSDSCTVWQYSSAGQVAGINGNVDVDVRYQFKLKGDVNGDNTVNLKDVVLIRRYIAGGWNVELDETVADVNGDNTVNLKDVVLIRRYIAGGWGVNL